VTSPHKTNFVKSNRLKKKKINEQKSEKNAQPLSPKKRPNKKIIINCKKDINTKFNWSIFLSVIFYIRKRFKIISRNK
jgi:hypothetical protein